MLVKSDSAGQISELALLFLGKKPGNESRSREQKHPFDCRNGAFNLSDKTFMRVRELSCPGIMACDSNLLPNRKDLPRNVRTTQGNAYKMVG